MSTSSSSNIVKPEFSIRIVVCDHYLSKPVPGLDVIYSDFRGSDIKQVPILRVFGPAADGHKACLHIHGVFPYFYVPCPTPNPVPQFLYQIAASLDKALNIALKQATSANQHVYKITLVKGLPFYGFHDKDHLYLKIFLYSPGLIKQAVELCSNGAILGQTFQPHESHLNFTLQFFIDFNLFGMSNIDLQTVKFRKSGLSQNSNEPLQSCDGGLKAESVCYYEADCVASHIINRQRIGKGDGIENPGLEEVWNQELERRKQLNMSIASKSLSQGRIRSEETESHYKFEQMLLIKMSNLIDKPVDVVPQTKKIMEEVYYPAESIDGSQLLNAVDVSMHLPENVFSGSFCDSLRRDLDETLTEDLDHTIVDENVALNSSLSLHYSQVLLNSEDLELLDILQDMDDKPVEEDSVMGTPANIDKDEEEEFDDAEYSQAYDEDTLMMDPFESKDDTDTTSPSTWNDTFWDGANIPQLDGTCDDDHVKKVRKRKMRPFKLGLSRPKSKKKDKVNILDKECDSEVTDISTQPLSDWSSSKNNTCNVSQPFDVDSDNDADMTQIDEIDVSRETIDSISNSHIRKNMKIEPESIVDDSIETNVKEEKETRNEDESIMDLVTKVTVKHEKLGAAESYDLENRFEPAAGPSTKNHKVLEKSAEIDDSINASYDSSLEESKLGIMSFYNASKIFDVSLSNEKQVTNKHVESNKPKSMSDVVVLKNIEQSNKQEAKNSSEFDSETSHIDTLRLSTMSDSFITLTPKIRPPSKNYILTTLDKYKMCKTKNPEPYFSDHRDVGEKVEIGQIVLKLHSKSAKDQAPFENTTEGTTLEEWRQLLFLETNETTEEISKPDSLKMLLASNRGCVLEPLKRPPTSSEVIRYLQNKEDLKESQKYINIKEISENLDDLENSQALGLNEDVINSSLSLESNDKEKPSMNESLQVTMQPDGSFLCFGNSESKIENTLEAPTVEVDFLTVMLLEVHTSVRGDLNPDPAMDPIKAVFLTITNDCPPNHFLTKTRTEMIVADETKPPRILDRCIYNANITYVNNECDILEKIIGLVKTHDPDIMCGYDIEMNSWGYVMERAQILGLEIVKETSRITEKYRQKRWRSDEKEFEGRIIGRITFNVWRLFRYELALSSYSFENCMYEILKERVPKYSYAQLDEWWTHESRILRWIPVEYYLTKLSGTVRMLRKLDIINRTSELARLFGLQWWEVLSRGSQFRVESLMLRAARPLNLIALSPTVKQRAAMRAPECLPLIFEPESRFYTDPVIVLDFQSLYPSMMIAYNYCFSTCIGRVQNINGDAAYEFGAWRLRIPKAKLEALVRNGLVHWSPMGVGFVKSSVRRGVLPALLRRILAARQAVKKSMKLQTDEAVKKAMHSRQLGLKLIANVTYGYTAANFSGRMPCVEVGDSVVAKGRETLERAIKLVRENTHWNAKVVYGDTDSMFVLVPGGTRAEAFEIGRQIADAVTADNPSPVALKLEKVYQPCILQTKKRYVGYMYESADQEKPVYEAKGIETVRRDGCPAGVKLLQRSLCELFDSGDMSRVKRIVLNLLSKLVDGSLPPQELFFTREYHGPNGYRPGAAAPPNEIAKRLSTRDRRATPRTGERVAWLVTAGAPGAALVKLARTPRELVVAPELTPHIVYYATRVLLPPLHRCLSLLGVDVFKWWRELGYMREAQVTRLTHGGIARYMWRSRCALCGVRDSRAVCTRCAAQQTAAAALATRLATAQAHLNYCERICSSCCGNTQSAECKNTECPVLWRRIAAQQNLTHAQEVVTFLPTFDVETMDF